MGSIFRNSTSYLDRYFDQARQLRAVLALHQQELRLVLVEGDSRDDTWAKLESRKSEFDLTLVKRHHGGPAWGSVDDAARWAALGWCCNGVLEHLTMRDDALVYVESDLLWDSLTMVRLLNQLSPAHPAIAAMCFTSSGAFYDTWGNRKSGKGFGPFPPYHDELSPTELTQIESAGSCIVMLGEVARTVRFGPDCMLGLGRSIYDKGYSLWVDPQAKVVQS